MTWQYALLTLLGVAVAGFLGWLASRESAKAQVKAAEITAAVAKANAAELAQASKDKADQADLESLRSWYRDAFAEVTVRLTAAEVRADAAEERANESGQRADGAARDRRHAEDRADQAERTATETSRRCDEIEQKMDLMVPFVDSLQTEIGRLGGHPFPTPRELIPLLT